MAKLQLEIGKSYRGYNGEVVTILESSLTKFPFGPYYGSNNHSYFGDGRIQHPHDKYQRDLREEVIPRSPEDLEEARKQALQICFDTLTNHMTDECPDDQSWEDFDADIDDLRTRLSKLLSP